MRVFSFFSNSKQLVEVRAAAADPNTPADLTTLVRFEEAARKIKLVKIICGVTIALAVFGEIGSLIGLVFNGYFDPTSQLATFLTLPAYVFCYHLAQRQRAEAASQLLVGIATSSIVVTYIAIGSVVPLVIVIAPIVLACVLLQIRGVLVVATACLSTALSVVLAQDVFGVYHPSAVANMAQVHVTAQIVSIVSVIPGLIALIYLPARAQSQALHRHIEQLELTFQELNERYETNHTISQQVVGLAQELRHSAREQSNGSTKQLSLVEQLNSSVTELSSVAAQIAGTAQHFSDTIEVVVEGSEGVKASAIEATTQGQQGLRAVQRCTDTAQQVAQVYANLVETLTELSEQSSQMQTVLTLVNNLSQETHLLALNAAIEAVGAGVHGERFGVIAQEVKHLANRSNGANQQVIGIVNHIQTKMNEALAAAHSGYSQAQLMSESVIEAGQVIEGMGEVVMQTQYKVMANSERLHMVKSQVETISIATDQQRSASLQVVQALQSLKEVAQQSATASDLVSSSAANLEGTSSALRSAALTRHPVPAPVAVPVKVGIGAGAGSLVTSNP